MEGEDALLTVRSAGKKYGARWVLRDVSFSLDAGEVLGVLGENGAGKSTLLSIAATLQKPTQGEILYRGVPVRAGGRRQYRARIGYVPQEIALFEELSGRDNLLFFGRAYHVPGKRLAERIGEVCAIVSFPEEALGRRVSEYSGGMKRKINIAAALLHEPELLLLDEPTANIDFHAEEQIVTAIREIAASGVAVVYVGHQMELVERLCTGLCLLRDGTQVLTGTVGQLLAASGGKKTLRQLCEEQWYQEET